MPSDHRHARKRLWDSHTQSAAPDELSTVESVLVLYATRPSKIKLFTLCCNALVVVQEFSLTCFVLARHRMVWLQQELLTHKTQQNYIEASNLFLIAALLVAVACGNSQPTTQDRSTKVKQRVVDSVLLSFALRFASSFLQSLTASYSSDTVHRLAILGMLWHVLACDYSYANGCVKTGVTSGSRPIFGGGTFSLNAALFSTTLLVSRIYDNQTVFLFISLSVVVFAFYSTTRHEMAKTHPAHSSGTCDFDTHRLHCRISLTAPDSVAPWLITALVIMATLCLIFNNLNLATTFLLCNLILGGVGPFWKHSLQHFQVLLNGPWDVAQIVPLA